MGEKDKQKTKAVKTDSKKGSVKTMKSSKASTSSAHAPVVIVEAEVVERVRGLTSQMRFVDALTLCDEELKRVEETFNTKKHSSKKQKKWLSKFNAQTQDARDVIATDFVVNFHAMAVELAIFSRDFSRFVFKRDASVLQLVFGKRDVTQLPALVRGVAGAIDTQTGRELIDNFIGFSLKTKFDRATKLLKGLVKREWRCAYAEAVTGSAKDLPSQLHALKTWNWLDYPLESTEWQGYLVSAVLLDLETAKRQLTADEHHLVCYSVMRNLGASITCSLYKHFNLIFLYFSFMERHNILTSADSDDDGKVFEQVRQVLLQYFEKAVYCDDDDRTQLLLSVWHGRHVFCGDADLRRAIAGRFASSLLLRCSSPASFKYLFRAVVATELGSLEIADLLKKIIHAMKHRGTKTLKINMALFYLASAQDDFVRKGFEALHLCDEVETHLTSLALEEPPEDLLEELLDVQTNGVEFALGLVDFVRRRWESAITHFERAHITNFFGGNLFCFFKGFINLLPCIELQEQLSRNPNKFILASVFTLSQFYLLQCRIKMGQHIGKTAAREFATRDVKTFNENYVWFVECSQWEEPSDTPFMKQVKALNHIMAFVLFKQVRDRSSARSELQLARKHLGSNWSLYSQYLQSTEEL